MILYDDLKTWTNLLPLTFTRSIAECRVGILTIQEKWAKYMDEEVEVDCTLDYLKVETKVHDLIVRSDALPSIELIQEIKSLPENSILHYKGKEIASYKKSDKPEIVNYKGDISFIQYPWHIFLENGNEIKKDFELLTKNRKTADISADNHVLGTDIFIEESAKVHCSILNSNSGPIYIGKDAEIMEGSIIRGPFAICEKSQVKMGAKIYGPTTIGPASKVGGEVTNTIFFANSNKAHDGYLGNSVIGEWCNLGADTNSSNLKNNYSKVEIYNYQEKASIDTGQQFLGLIMGDHSKSGINTMFNTGTVVGVCANIVGAGFPKKHIPSFSWSISERIRPYNFEKAMETVEIVYGRRNRRLTDRDRKILEYLYQETIRD